MEITRRLAPIEMSRNSSRQVDFKKSTLYSQGCSYSSRPLLEMQSSFPGET